MAIVAASGLAQDNLANGYQYEPVAGGTYRGGVLLSSPSDREAITDALTKTGLVEISSDNTVVPGLAESWEYADDFQTLRVKLSDRLSARDAADLLKQQTKVGYWKDADIQSIDDNRLEFRLSKPWAGYITELVAPVFPFGPYELDAKKSDKPDVLYFTANERAVDPPYFSKVELHLFADSRTLDRALRKGSLDGAYLGESSDITPPNSWQLAESILPRQYLTFLNLRQGKLGDVVVRQRLTRFERFEQPLELRLVTADSDSMLALAQDLQARWAEQNVTVNIENYPLITLGKSIIPERNYDLLLLGVDYGPDGDLYPYWHSSQMASPGLNLAGYRNKEVDRLLDEARKETDMNARHERYAQAEKILTEEAAVLEVPSPSVVLTRSPRIKGEVPEALRTATERWSVIADWYLKQRRIPKQS